ncbi:hypothetical protein Tco_0444978 [Tanacetum coccineum]
MLKNMRKSFVHKNNVKELLKNIDEAFIDVVPKLVTKVTDQNRQDNFLWLVVDAIKLEREKYTAELSSMISDAIQKVYEGTRAELSSKVTNDLVANVPQQVDAFLRNYMNTNILHVHPTSLSSSIPDLQQYHDDHHDDDSLPEGESSAKRQKMFEDQETDDDEVPSEEAMPEFLAKISGSDT